MNPTIPMSVFKARRDRLLSEIGEAVLILPAAVEQIRNRDVHYPFRQDSDFFYLTNFVEPGAILLLDGKTKQSVLFSKKLDPLYAIWEGKIVGQDSAKSKYLFDESYSLELLDEKLLTYLYAHQEVITPFSRYPAFDGKLLGLIKQVKETRRALAPQVITHSDKIIHPMRLIKDEYEIKMLTKAAEISAEAHKKAMQLTQTGMNECEVAASFDYEFSKSNCPSAYGHIIGGGNNACTLHYKENNAKLNDGDLVLIDAGAEYKGYAGDITRTFPVNGKFSDAQAKVYNWVLKSMDAALVACKPGNHIRSPHFAAEEVLIEAMQDLGLLKGSIASIKENKSYEKYFMHGTSHWLGLDVHDVGDYKADGEWTTLKAGMAITVEPGIYIREDDMDAPVELRGIGIRIEDDIIIAEHGHINLTKQAPKTIEEIEMLCTKGNF